MSHAMSILILILRLRVSKSAVGISLKTQELFLLVFVTRYLDLFTTFYSFYNSFMKVAYISSTTRVARVLPPRPQNGAESAPSNRRYIIHMIRFKEPYRSKYDKSQDSFLHYKFAVAPCVRKHTTVSIPDCPAHLP